MKNKTVIITGATAGIGLAAAEELARRGARVVGISRSADKCARVAARLREKTGNGDIGIFCADLSSMDEVRRVAGDILAQIPRIDVLINNAGGIFLSRELTVDGFEKTFALNHLSGFLFTKLLLDRVIESAPARIINVSSSAQYSGKILFEDLHRAKRYRPMAAYGQSKLANMLFTHELDRRINDPGVSVNAMHPGLVRTDLGKDNGWLARLLQPLILLGARRPDHGARTIVYLATSPEVEGVSGKFFIDEKEAKPAKASKSLEDAKRLWDMSEAIVRPFLRED